MAECVGKRMRAVVFLHPWTYQMHPISSYYVTVDEGADGWGSAGVMYQDPTKILNPQGYNQNPLVTFGGSGNGFPV